MYFVYTYIYKIFFRAWEKVLSSKKNSFKQKMKNNLLTGLGDHISVSHQLKSSQFPFLLENREIECCLHYGVRGQFLQSKCKINTLVFYFTGGLFILLSQLASLVLPNYHTWICRIITIRRVGFTKCFLKLNKTQGYKRGKYYWYCNAGFNEKTLAEEEQKFSSLFSSVIPWSLLTDVCLTCF